MKKNFVRLLMSTLQNVANRVRAAQSKVNCIYFIFLFKQRIQQPSTMTDKTKPSLATLPVELFYRILDHLSDYNILCSIQNVSTRINTIISIYYRYQVNLLLDFNILLLSSEDESNHNSTSD